MDWLDRGSAWSQLPGTIKKELMETLKITLRETIEFNRQDAIVAAGSIYHEEQIAV